MPAASIILTSYERPSYLDEAVHAIRAQTFGDFELLICDDASAPDVAEVIRRHAADDERVRDLRGETRQGVVANVIRGLLAAKGTLVSICNDDDTWEPDFLDAAVKALDGHPGAAVAFSDHHIMDEHGNINVGETEENTRRWKRDTLLAGLHQPFTRLAVVDQAVPMVMATVFRRDAIDLEEIPSKVGAHYDLWLAYLAARDGAAAVYIPQRLTRYRVHPHAATAARDPANAGASVYIWEQLLADDRLKDLRSELRRKLHLSLVSYGARSLDDPPASRRAFMSALRLHPSARALAGLALSVTPGSVRSRVR